MAECKNNNGALWSRKYTNKNSGELREAFARYFEEHPNKSNPPTITGLTRAAGCHEFRRLQDWALNESPGVEIVADITKEALIKLYEQYETWGILHNGNPAFVIFMMKNFGFTDRTEIGLDHTADSFIAELNAAISKKEN
ncbi:MAG: terminase small subunit [Eubacteriales bacterium]|jgi:hypothetical protein